MWDLSTHSFRAFVGSQEGCVAYVKYVLPLTHPLLAVENVSITLSGLKILDEVSIGAPEGAVTGLIGPNGAGKTTVFNVLSGFLTPDQGIVRFDGKKLKHIKTHHLTKLGISRTLQGVGLFESLTALENVMLGGSAGVKSGIVADSLGAPWADSAQNKLRAQAMEIMGEFGIADSADRYPSELPYPVQKRVAIARSLISDPKVLLLDEPAGGISAGDMAELGRMIRSWTPERTVLLVEHHMELVMEVCDLIWVLDAGKVIASGTPAQVRTNPAVLAAYLGEDGGNADVGNG
jgi:branched-chain amino acid transport system ATP-binding protein